MDVLFGWLLGGLFLAMIFRLATHKKQSLLTLLFAVVLWPLLPIGLLLYGGLLILAALVRLLSKVKV